jgi:EAL domain-containing protein (putative c-di-GMP-specific phosphodiesterase class I)
VTVSVGVVACDGGSHTPEVALRDAGVALQCAKRKGVSQVCLFDEAVRTRNERRWRLERDLAHAVARHELAVLYQPVVDVSTGRVVGAEALLRWHHPELGLVPPDEFVPLAEETGDILGIGSFVIREAARTAALLRRSSRQHLYVALNVSSRQLVDVSLAATVARAATQAGCTTGDLVVEVTETALAWDADVAQASLAALRDAGVRIAIDDFGTGYSSLAQLRALPVDVLKVDRSFVGGVPHDAEDLAVVGAVLNMATALGKTVVAEGIETQEQRDALVALGCRYAQGYLWARPDTAEALLALIARESEPAPTGG